MPRRTFPLGILAFMLCFPILYGQQGITASGADANGVGGTMSYSVGQMDYTAYSGPTGAITLGVQQPYLEIMVGSEELTNNLTIRLFPNPSSSYTSISVDEFQSLTDLNSFSYQLYDIYGNHLWSEHIASPQSTIPASGLVSGMYILKVIYKKQSIKTFRFIKTE